MSASSLARFVRVFLFLAALRLAAPAFSLGFLPFGARFPLLVSGLRRRWPTSGIKQGCPMSGSMFTLCVDPSSGASSFDPWLISFASPHMPTTWRWSSCRWRFASSGVYDGSGAFVRRVCVLIQAIVRKGKKYSMARTATRCAHTQGAQTVPPVQRRCRGRCAPSAFRTPGAVVTLVLRRFLSMAEIGWLRLAWT